MTAPKNGVAIAENSASQKSLPTVPIVPFTPAASRVKTVRKFNLIASKTGFLVPSETIRTSRDAFHIARRIHALEGNDFQEFFYVIFLNQANRPTGYYLASMGGICGTVADPRLILKAAILADCTAIVLVHNHPSGNINPSRADEELTLKIKQGGNLLDIRVLDHIIYADEYAYYSFGDEGKI